MKVNNVNTQYEIPGFDIAPQAFEPGEDDDFEGAPYSRDPGVISPPPAGGWQQLLGLLRLIAECKLDGSERGCALANAAIQLPDRNHPARRVIEEYKSLHHDKIIGLCRRAGLRDPELLADELFLLGEGARVSIQSCGPGGPAERLTEMFQTVVAAHDGPPRRP